ncbi:formylglycine-generating enzyme family protein [Aureispira]|nr:formylglycine-generating enzyme family protein [Aureispira sp.]
MRHIKTNLLKSFFQKNILSSSLIISILIIFYMPFNSLANNLQITNVTLTNDSTLTFSVSWENSWKISTSPPNNHDAVWIFIKSKNCASVQWQHVNISKNSASHSTAAPLEIYIDTQDVASNATGLFLRRSSDGSGNISNVQVSVRIAGLPLGQYDFKVFGIEMVQIPQGPFYLGDVVSHQTFRGGGTSNPYYVNSETGHTVGNTSGQLYFLAHTNAYDVPNNNTLSNPLFPKGYAEFYCMKYEISQGQFVDFVNTLTTAQYSNVALHTSAASADYRFGYTGAHPVLVSTTPHRAACFLNWTDLLAYLDWAALKPMTEMQFEKACRGPDYPVQWEFAWGSSILTNSTVVASDGTPSEHVTNSITAGGGIMNHGTNSNNWSGVKGPLRCGFAANATSTRLTSGASYYGVLEMSGNVFEQVITTCVYASSYNGNVGDGVLTVGANAGFANQGWPYETAGQTSNSVGARTLRGGSYHTYNFYATISSRIYAGYRDNRRSVHQQYGGRGIR